MNKNMFKSAMITLVAVCSFSSQATLIGVFGDETAAASTIATNLGYDVEVISDYSNLGIYDVVWGLNGSNSSHESGLVNNTTMIDNYVLDGGVFLYHDRYVTDADLFLPGADNFNFVRDTTATIDLVGPSDVAKNDIDDTTLDGGNSSTHGYVEEASLDLSFTGIFNNGISDRLVDFTYEFGAGNVYYSSIPLDFYIQGSNPVAFRSIYAPNVLAFNAGLAESTDIPEPEMLLIFGTALMCFGFGRRKVKS